MDYWKGKMNWPLAEGWKCDVCKIYSGLTWGLINGECRCNNCHTHYMMRLHDIILTIPICQLKPEYFEAAGKGWRKYSKPIDEFSDKEWDDLLVIEKEA